MHASRHLVALRSVFTSVRGCVRLSLKNRQNQRSAEACLSSTDSNVASGERTRFAAISLLGRQARVTRPLQRRTIGVAVLIAVLVIGGTLVGGSNSAPGTVKARAVVATKSVTTGGRGANSITSPGSANVANSNSTCSPTTDAATSGGSPSTLMSSATQVASGTTDGHSWSLWSAKGESGASALEDGGLVLDGHEFGICPGYPNPAELEMLNVGSQAIVYGVIGYPGLATVNLSVGTIGSFATGAALPSPQVQVVDGVSFFIGALPNSACSYTALELNTTSPGVSAEHNLGFGGTGEGTGYPNPDNAGNTGGCVPNQIDPISFSQGIWQLPPGQFTNGF